VERSFEIRLAAVLCGLLSQGLRLDSTCCKTIAQVLDTDDVSQLEVCLARRSDAEAESMRALAFFPDVRLALAVEQWLVREHGDLSATALNMDVLAFALDGAGVRLTLPGMGEIRLSFRQDDARQFLKRLHLDKHVPQGVAALLRKYSDTLDEQTILGVRILCKRIQVDWSPAKKKFLLALLRGSCRADPRDELRTHLLPLLEWCLGFLSHVGEDVPTALSCRRDSLRKHLDQVEEVKIIREKYNFETRRMLGMVEPSIDPTALRKEMIMVDMAAKATDINPFFASATEWDLGNAPSMQQAINVLDENSGSNYTHNIGCIVKPQP